MAQSQDIGVSLNWTNTLTILLGLAASGLTVDLILNARRRRKLHKMFDEDGLPSLEDKNLADGNAHHIFVQNNYCKLFMEHHKRFGKSYGYFYGPNPVFLTTDLDLIHRILVTEGNKHINFPDMRLPTIPLISDSILFKKDDEWRSIRRSLNPTLTHKQIRSEQVTKDLDDSCEKLLKWVESHPMEAVDDSQARIVDVLFGFTAYSMDIILRVALERRDMLDMTSVERKDKFLVQVIEAIENFFNPLIYLSISFDRFQGVLGFLGRFSKFGAYQSRVSTLFDESFKLRMQKLTSDHNSSRPGDPNRILDTVLRWPYDNKMHNVSAKAQLYFLFVAGFATTSNTLTIMFWLLAKHQKVQDELRQALVLEGSEAAYLDWCIKETLRLYPAVPITGRILANDINLSDGRRVRKGVGFMVDIYSIHHSAELWGEDVEEFQPERFAKPLEHPQQFIGFGAGPRGCIGRHLAEKEMRLIVTRLLLRYRLEPCSSTPEELQWNVLNIIHMLIDGPINLKFTELLSS